MGHPRERRPFGRNLDRREFLKRTAGAAVAAPSLAAILAACSKPGTALPSGGALAIGDGGIVKEGYPYPLARPDNPVTWHIFDDNKPIPSGQSPETGATLQIYNWIDYIWKNSLHAFKTQFNCDIKITTFNNEEEAINKMTSGDVAFDVFFPTTDYVGKLVTKKILRPLNRDYIPNLEANIWPYFQNPFYDGEARYTVPYTVYSTGIQYARQPTSGDPNFISDEELRAMSNPYDILWDPKWKGQTGVLDSYRDVMCMTLLRRGVTDLNTEDPAIIQQAGQDLLDLLDATSPKVGTKVGYIAFPGEQINVDASWSGDSTASWGYVTQYDQAHYERIGYWYPEDRKGAIGNDLIGIPSSAPNPVLAHEFLNYMLDTDHSLYNFSWNGYQPPLNAINPDTLPTTSGVYGNLGWAKASNGGEPIPYVFDWLKDAIVRKDDFTTGYQIAELSPDVNDLWTSQWDRFQSG
ncbi:MAG: extracellular solute-binding protein [Actinomycetota bacterium]|nr:extracellular solute-binding protein [Actinomycetota bacterium]